MIFQKALIDSLVVNGHRTAIEQGEERLSYAELLGTANKITRFLQGREPEPEAVIGIRLDSRPDLIAAMIGIANARCIFAPIDGTLPESRVAAMLAAMQPDCIIASRDDAGAGRPAGDGFPATFFVEDILAGAEAAPEGMQYPAYDGNDGLYIYFTSGTTGIPKGIVGKNCSLLHFIRWEIEAFGIDGNSRFSQFISPYFDAFLRDVFVPLLAGGTICIPPAGKAFFAPESLVPWIDSNRISLIHCVPSLFRVINDPALTPDHFKALRHVLLSGERIIPSELHNWYQVFGAGIQLVNLYGPTEATMIRTWYKIRPEDAHQAKIPIGKPIPGTELLIAGKGLKPCKVLVPGDLYIVSDYMTKGYLNAPELTAEKFINIRTGTPDEAVAFKTGDKARLLANGNVDLLGREDRQIKLSGVRIELDEVESVICGSEYVKNAVVIKQEAGPEAGAGSESLVAFLIGNDRRQEAGHFPDAVREHLARHLPAYMIPAQWVEVTEFPLLSNGKIDYPALAKQTVRQVIVAPANQTEARLLAVWKDLFGKARISTDESFHRMGGNSLSVMRLVGRIYNEFNVRISLGELFTNPTIQEQARVIKSATQDDLMVIEPTAAKPAYVLSSAQERMYFTHELDQESTAYNMPVAWWISSAVSKERIEDVLRGLIDRHESLRTEFRSVDGKLLQVIRESVDFVLEEIDCRDQEPQPVIERFIRPFDLNHAPLVRGAILRTGGSRNILALDMHHIICDGASQVQMQTEFVRLLKGETLRPLSVQYKDYAEWECAFKATDAYIAHREFWLKGFEGDIPDLNLHATGSEGLETTGEGASLDFRIGHATLGPVFDSLEGEEISAFSALFAANLMFLSQLTGQEDLVVATPTTGRMQKELEEVVGMFVKTLPIRYVLDPEQSFRELARDVHQYLVQANSKQMYDLADLMNQLNKTRTTFLKSLFGATFVFQNLSVLAPVAGDEDFQVYPLESSTAKCPLTLFAYEGTDALAFRLEYASDYFTRTDAQLLVDRFKALVEKIAQNPDAKVAHCIAGEPSEPVAVDNIAFNF